MKSRRTQNELLFSADFGSEELIRPFFFENEQGVAVTANDDRYRAILYEIFVQKIEEGDIGNIKKKFEKIFTSFLLEHFKKKSFFG